MLDATSNGVTGYLFGNTLFLPYSGYVPETSYVENELRGLLWSTPRYRNSVCKHKLYQWSINRLRPFGVPFPELLCSTLCSEYIAVRITMIVPPPDSHSSFEYSTYKNGPTVLTNKYFRPKGNIYVCLLVFPALQARGNTF